MEREGSRQKRKRQGAVWGEGTVAARWACGAWTQDPWLLGIDVLGQHYHIHVKWRRHRNERTTVTMWILEKELS